MKTFWSDEPFVIGMVHLAPLPGSPRYRGSLEACRAAALEDARRCAAAGIDALLVENHGDAPFLKDDLEPHAAAVMGVIARDVSRDTGLPVGVNCLRNDARSALAAAVAAGGAFVRVNVLTGVTATDQGVVEGRAGEVLRYRHALAADDVLILADLDVKFGTSLFRAPLEDALTSLVHRGGADGVIVTGTATGRPPAAARVEELRAALGPGSLLLVGSGVDPDNVSDLAAAANGVIVGTALKEGGDVHAPVDPARARALMDAVRRLR